VQVTKLNQPRRDSGTRGGEQRYQSAITRLDVTLGEDFIVQRNEKTSETLTRECWNRSRIFLVCP
jgi:hypothetical protein